MKFSKIILLILLFFYGCKTPILLSERVTKKDREYIKRTNELIKNQKYDETIETLDSALKYDPFYCTFHAYKGYTFLLQKKFTYGLVEYNTYLQHHPNDYNAYVNRGIIKAELKDTAGAIKDYSKALSIKSQDYMIYVRRGYLEMNQGHFEFAFCDFNNAIKLCSKCECWNCCYAFNLRGMLFLKMNDTSSAISDFNFSIDRYKYFFLAHINLAKTLINQNKKEEAFEKFEKTLKEFKEEGDKSISNYNYFTINWGKYLAENEYKKEALPYLKYSLEKKLYDSLLTESELRELIKKCESE